MRAHAAITGTLGGKYYFRVRRANGRMEDLGSQRNLITRIGIDRITTGTTTGASTYTQTWTFCRAGTGSTPAAVTNTALEAQTVSTGNYVQTTGANGSTYNTTNGSATHKRTFIFDAATGASTIREIGVGWTASTASTLFSRIVLNTPITLAAGDILYVVYTLNVSIPQVVTATPINLVAGTFSMVGSFRVTGSMENIFGGITSTGGGSGASAFTPGGTLTGSNANRIYLGTNTAFPAVNSVVTLSGSNISTLLASAVHANGTNVTTWTVEYPAAGAVSGIRTIGVSNGPAAQPTLWILLDSAQTKENNKLLRFTFASTFTQI